MRLFPGWPASLVFVTVITSSAFFWHTRDWNTASRLMLTYAIVDRGTVSISRLDGQTGDKAWFQGNYYSDKLPGYPLMATLPYFLAKRALGFLDHPLDHDPMRYWAADYWTTLGTSGIVTATTAALLVAAAMAIGCGPARAGLVGLAYGLATPAYVYATLAYGHQSAACALFSSFLLLIRPKGARDRDKVAVFFAGMLAAFAAVIELQVGPVSAILGVFLLVQCLRGDRRGDALGIFFVGALIPTLVLLLYHQLAFGSPWEMGYFHHATREFAAVHSAANPLGLRRPDWSKLVPLLWGRYRGLVCYAPILALAVPGWVVLLARRSWDLAGVTLSAVAAVVLVNLSYPEWTGGWSTGPRLLLPAIPFAMVPVAALLAGRSRRATIATIVALALAIGGGVEMLLFQGVGGRIPPFVHDPIPDAIWPLWTTGNPPPIWTFGSRFESNLASLIAPAAIDALDPRWRALQFLPVVALQVLAAIGLWLLRDRTHADESSP